MLERTRFVSPEVLEAAIDAETYVLGPHDILAVMILAGQTRLERLPVLPEGVVVVPGVGAVPASGRTIVEFREALRRELSRHYQNFELYSYLAVARQVRVYVTGEVREPGTLVARPYERVSDVVERAGGFTEMASRRFIELSRTDGNSGASMRVDLGAYYLRGELDSNPQLMAANAVFVPPRRNEVEILGEVAVPGTYELVEGELLRDLLDLAGGPTPHADLSHVSVDAFDANGAATVHTYDLHSESPRVERAVRVSVISSLLGRRRVFVIAPDGGDHVLYLSPSETLHDLVRRVAQLERDTDLAEARLVTRDSTGARIELPVDIARILAGAGDRPLQDGDVLSVPAVKDYVYVSGFVARPGRYPYRADWTVGDYLGEAGGTTGTGNRKKATLFGSSGDERSTDRGGRVQRGDTIHVNESTGSKIRGAVGVFASLAALALSVVALSRN
jgi:protein involved in polysaccharide export with SLBB domain